MASSTEDSSPGLAASSCNHELPLILKVKRLRQEDNNHETYSDEPQQDPTAAAVAVPVYEGKPGDEAARFHKAGEGLSLLSKDENEEMFSDEVQQDSASAEAAAVYEGKATDEGARFHKTGEGLSALPSLDTADETTTDGGGSSCSTQAGSPADSTANLCQDGSYSHPVSQGKSRRSLLAFTISIVMLVIVIATLGATGHFQNISNRGADSSVDSGSGDDVKVPDQPVVGSNATGDDTEGVDAQLEGSTAPPSAVAPTSEPRPMTYVPGLLTVEENGLLLSQRLTSRLIAQRRRPVQYANGELSVEPFHRRPDYGACFAVPPDATENRGGWVYVSNSELEGPPSGQGGVGALHFDKDGNVIHYQMLLTNTTKNCAGGRTPWETFVSCEEVEDVGQIYQVDPFNRRKPERISMGLLGGRYEAFAFDNRDRSAPRFFVTEDLKNGPTVRWTPDPETTDWDDPWTILTGNGTLEYLFLEPVATSDKNRATEPGATSGTFGWIRNLTLARENAALYARGTEGIDRHGSFLYFVCKTDKLFYILDLDLGTFVRYPASIGLFDGEPDQVKRMVNDTQDVLYFSEEGSGSGPSGIHGRNSRGQYFTILEGPGYSGEETTGLAFSPNGLHMYVAFQDPGLLFDITRTDGYPFHGLTLDVRYHNPPRPLDRFF